MKKNILKITITILFFFILLHAGYPLLSQTTGESGAKSGSLSSANLKERINFIQSAFANRQTCAKWYYWGWVTIYSGGVGLYSTLAVARDSKRVSNIVTASKSALALSVLIIRPYGPRYSADEFQALPESTESEMEKKVRIGESWLERNSSIAQRRTSILRHLIPFVVQAIGGVIVWHYENLTNGLLNFGLGMAVVEAQIWTMPPGPIDDYHRY
jgi:hypothetical protein